MIKKNDKTQRTDTKIYIQNNANSDNHTITIIMNDYLYYDNVLPLHGGVKEKQIIEGKGKIMETLQRYKDYLAVEHRKEYTQRYYYDTIRKLLIDINKDIDDITKQDINDWITQKNKQQLRIGRKCERCGKIIIGWMHRNGTGNNNNK